MSALVSTLKAFLLELAGHQDGVGAVLEEGARMLSEGGLSRDEEDEVRVQMRLLNSRWEDLRIKAMERQSRYSPGYKGIFIYCVLCVAMLCCRKLCLIHLNIGPEVPIFRI
jgi:hypothetical protein